jgi:zinc-binding alcohol dehydrogenase family protein
MKVIGYSASLPISDDNALKSFDVETPSARGRDVLVKVKAIAVNPVDCKIRQRVTPQNGDIKVLGWDAVGEITQIGDEVENFAIGDRVFYAGDLTRQGSNAEFQLVDERIIAKAPATLSDSDAAALPLTAITAWELLFTHLALPKMTEESVPASKDIVLVVGAAGGVGSIMVQLLKKLTNATVIATASRESSKQWVTNLGADYVVDHTQPLAEQIECLDIGQVTHVASLNHTDSYIDDYVTVMKPMGKIALIDDPESLDIKKLKQKSLSLHWEFMFTRSMFTTEDMDEQGKLLSNVAQLIDNGVLRTTVGKHLGKINAQNIINAHRELEAGRVIGKLVLEGF